MPIEDPSRGSPSPTAGQAASGPEADSQFDAKAWLTQTAGELRESFARNRRVMSFGEYFSLFGADAGRQVRSAAQYVRDVFDHFGTELVRTPRGVMTRWKLFDCPWDAGKDALVGQEEVQAAVYRLGWDVARGGGTKPPLPLPAPDGSATPTSAS